MSCAANSTPATTSATPGSDLAAFLVERNYKELGCDRWNTRRVLELLAKLKETPTILAARLRIRPAEFTRRVDSDCWTKQDQLILTLIEREVDFLRGGAVPRGRLITGGAP